MAINVAKVRQFGKVRVAAVMADPVGEAFSWVGGPPLGGVAISEGFMMVYAI